MSTNPEQDRAALVAELGRADAELGRAGAEWDRAYAALTEYDRTHRVIKRTPPRTGDR